MNQKGQASSVFQLLIAAIVAVAILVILLGVLNIIPIGFGKSPKDESVKLLDQAANGRGALVRSVNVQFKTNDDLRAQAIADNSAAGVPAANLCLNLGSFKSSTYFTNPTGKMITYIGSSSRSVSLSAVCDIGTGLHGALTDYKTVMPDAEATCDSVFGGNYTSSSDIYCVISLNNPR